MLALAPSRLSCVVEVAYIVVAQRNTGESVSSSFVQAIYALLGLADLAGIWSTVVLFASIVLFLRHRESAVRLITRHRVKQGGGAHSLL